jgi:hypothetical protein
MIMKEDISYETGIVTFIDILGFKEIVKKSEKNPRLLNTIYESLGFLKKRELPEKWNLQLVEIETDAQKRAIIDFDISNRTFSSAFSDSIVVSVIIDDQNIHASLSTLLANLSFVGSKFIMDGILIRGGITVGKIIHTETGIVFGQGLIDAYQLETRSAKYPRIILADKLISQLNYPLKTKKDRYPYHQYLKRFSDGCVGLHQLIYFQVLQSWEKMSKGRLESNLKKAKKTIIEGLDDSFEFPDVHKKYLWLKKEYENLIILEAQKPKIFEIGHNHDGSNIHYSYTDQINNKTQ